MNQYSLLSGEEAYVLAKRKINEAVAGKADLVNGKVPVAQLPGYVDDVVEGYYLDGVFYSDAEHTVEIVPELDTVYHDLTSNSQYRWGGTVYVNIGGNRIEFEDSGSGDIVISREVIY